MPIADHYRQLSDAYVQRVREGLDITLSLIQLPGFYGFAFFKTSHFGSYGKTASTCVVELSSQHDDTGGCGRNVGDSASLCTV